MSFSPDGLHLALASKDEVTILGLPSGTKATSTSIDSGKVNGCFFLDKDRLIINQFDLNITVFDLTGGDSRTVAGASWDDFVTFPGHNRAVVLSGLIPHLINTEKLEVTTLLAVPRPPSSLAFTSGSNQLLWGTYFKPLTSWNLTSGEAAARFYEAGFMPTFTVSDNGKFLAAPDEFSHRIRIFDLERDREDPPIPVKFSTVGDSVSLSSDGKSLRRRSPREILIFSLETRNQIASLSADHPTNIAVEPDGNHFALADKTGTNIYDVSHTPKRIGSLAPADKDITPYALRFSPDGKWLAVMENLQISLISTATWNVEQTIPGSTNLCLSFSPDSKEIAFTSQPNGI